MSQSQSVAAPTAGDKGEASAPASKGRAMSVLLVALMVCNLGATGFVGYRVLQPVEVDHPPPDAPKTEEKGFGPTVPLEPFVVNLNESDSNRYLKTVLELEVTDAKATDVVNRGKPFLRDEFLRYLSGLTVADTMGDAGKRKIQQELKDRSDKLLGEGAVKRLFFSEFVVQ